MRHRDCGAEALAGHARLQQFWDGAQSQPVLSAVVAQIGQAMAAARRTQSSSS
jgi:hypothetical protein